MYCMIDRALLEKHFGLSYMRPYQELIITRILESSESGSGTNLLCCLPTGSGKSLCFMYPILHLRRRAVIVYPLISLMNDQAKRFEEAGISCIVMRGGMDPEERRRRLRRIDEEEDAAVIANPEMLEAMERRGELSLLAGRTELFVIDEAHTAVTWGESFRASYRSIPRMLESIRPRSILAFTATMDERMKDAIISMVFSGSMPYIVHASSDRENIFYHSVKSLSRIQDAISLLSPPRSRPAVVFCRSRIGAEATARRLSRCFPTEFYHAGLERDEKKRKEDWFLSSRSGVLAATSAYGMGVDKKDIRTIIHMHIPDSVSDYLQESGRCGRDGQRADAYVLCTESDKGMLCGIFSGGGCIRSALLEAMGEGCGQGACLACSSCVPDGYRRAGEEEILRHFRIHPFSLISNAAMDLTRSSRLLRRGRLQGWEPWEVEEAIGRLIGEDRLIGIGKRAIAAEYGRFSFSALYGRISGKGASR